MTLARGLRLLLLLSLPALPATSGTAQSDRAASVSALSHYDLDPHAKAGPAWRAKLPRALSELSGLAFAPDGALLAHGDERAVVWRYDVATQRPMGRFGLGDDRGRVLHGDFEDVAVVGERVFLITSAGEIYEGRRAPDGRTGRAARRTRGLGPGCEAEGLTWDPDTRSLLILCKRARTKRWKDRMIVLAVSVDTWRLERAPRMLVARDALERATGKRQFHGSGIARHPRTGTLLVVAGPERTFVELSPRGEVLGGGRLDRDQHRQPESIAVAPDLTLLIGDEAAGRTASITAYAYRP